MGSWGKRAEWLLGGGSRVGVDGWGPAGVEERCAEGRGGWGV